ncbi:inorganic pyrophosphatase [Saccharicrinis fermentans]|uniref:inorganic diphosphatase n=1 Tax=Saccharicrinis fermentans DSM 9555 = JCM 21142 TaxID=869213 RepID=W7YER5_9BACT|nr:inorganic pyrophosphatase [Saccharicrinis fermentans]GAF02941.1 inorganic pyrophosphatase [Saccharicrinis fermentans DSM 9555 = JCM 21142]
MADEFTTNSLMDPIGRLMGLRYKSHPWHGINIGVKAPEIVNTFIEVVPTDTIKYEIDKETGYLKIDRPQKYSNVVPALYGFVPQTYCGPRIGKFCAEKSGREEIQGDGDPLDICVLTEKEVPHGDIIAQATPIGGFRMIDGNQADDKIIAVLKGDIVYGNMKDITELPELVVNRLKHYFLTYKDMPGLDADCEITHIYNAEEAKEVIKLSALDYDSRFDNLRNALSKY